MQTTLSRRSLLLATGVSVAGVATPRGRAATVRRLAGSLSPTPIAHSFVTRPDLAPPTVEILARTAGASPGSIFIAPFTLANPVTEASGPLILDGRGNPVWFRPVKGKTGMDLRVQRLRGQDVLTWWEGTPLGVYGGSWLIADSSYRVIGRVRAVNGYSGDLHDMVLTPRGTALVTIYSELRADLTPVGGAPDTRVVEGIVQEIDLRTGKALLEWHSLDHIALDESYELGVTRDGNVDYFHLNSIGLDADGHLLLSARHTHAIYKVHRRTGQVIWRLGGKRSDFALGPGAAFSYQHDARRHEDGTITLFDNASSLPTDHTTVSRAIRLDVNAGARTVRLVSEFRPTDIRTGWAMGNAQQLPDGGMFIGWGMYPGFSEFSPAGTVRFDAKFVGGSVSYRARRYRWVGRPTDRPAIAAKTTADGTTLVFTSWNGATEVARWRILAGSSRSDLRRARVVEKRGFEAAVGLGGSPRYVAVVALDREGRPLGVSETIAVGAASTEPVAAAA